MLDAARLDAATLDAATLDAAMKATHSTPYTSALPFEHDRIGAAAIYCSDGRYGDQMDEFLHACLGLPRYDRVAIPGGAACLTGAYRVHRQRSALEQQLQFLIESHELTRVVLIAHQDCGFYRHNAPAHQLRSTPLEELQAADLAKAAAAIRLYASKPTVDAYFARRVEGRVRFESVAT